MSELYNRPIEVYQYGPGMYFHRGLTLTFLSDMVLLNLYILSNRSGDEVGQ